VASSRRLAFGLLNSIFSSFLNRRRNPLFLPLESRITISVVRLLLHIRLPTWVRLGRYKTKQEPSSYESAGKAGLANHSGSELRVVVGFG